jgi:DNA recombination protein RmuC
LAQEERFRESQALAERNQRQAFEAQEARFQETLQKVTLELKTTTDEMLKQRQQEFSTTSAQNIGQIVNPLKESLETMRRTMDDSNLRHTALSSAMKQQIEQLMKQSEAARLSAEELARVFKHGSKIQGDWGETVLCELLDAHGLVNGVHYDTQITMRDAKGSVLKNEQGSMLRPDVIMHLDQKREIIIDSKVSLTAFMDYVNAETEEERQQYLKAHVDSLQKHVMELSKKDYSSFVCSPKVCMDYVIMFVPHTGALWTALNAQPNMWRKAMEKNVFIADEQTLFAALRIISLTWTQIAQAENHEKVYALANEMLDRVGQFMRRYQAIGKALDNAQTAYEDAEKKLQPNGQSILQTCAKLQKLGAKQSSTNPLPQIENFIEEQ